MADSDITVSALAAKPQVQAVALAWEFDDPNENGLWNLKLDAVEVLESPVNDRTDSGAAVVGEGRVNFTRAGLPEEVTKYYWIRPRNRAGYYGDWYPSSPTGGIAGRAIGMAGLAFSLANGRLDAAVDGSDNMVIAIKTAQGNDPSADEPVFVAYPYSSGGSGGYSILELTSALSLTISGINGGKLENDDGVSAFSTYVVLFDNDGTQVLAVINCNSSSDGHITALSQTALASTTTSADRGVFFAGTAVSNKTYRIIGRLIFNAGGAWDDPDFIDLHSLDAKLPSEYVQNKYTRQDSYASLTFPSPITKTPFDNTIPQWSEGGLWQDLRITPICAANVIEIDIEIPLTCTVAANITIALYRDSNDDGTPDSNDAVEAAWVYAPGSDLPVVARLQFSQVANQTSAIRYIVRVGSDTDGTINFGGINANQIYNAKMHATRRIREVVA